MTGRTTEIGTPFLNLPRIFVPVPTRERGMTLVEILVVLAIIAVTASAAVLALGGESNLRGVTEAKRIEARLQLAADQTMIESTPLAISITQSGYNFLQWDAKEGRWGPMIDSVLEEDFELPSDMQLRTDGAETVFPLGADRAGQPFLLHLDWKDWSWTIAFDGITARMVQSVPGAEEYPSANSLRGPAT